jgi:hypothetical protein
MKHRCHICKKHASKKTYNEKFLCIFHFFEYNFIHDYVLSLEKLKWIFRKIKRRKEQELHEMSVNVVKEYLSKTTNPLVREALKSVDVRVY